MGHKLYWSDREGMRVMRCEPEIVSTHLLEGIGIALDPAHDRMFVTDLGDNIYVAALDGSGHRPIRALQGNVTGIAYAEVPDGSSL